MQPLYLTRIELRTRHKPTGQLLENPNRLHGFVNRLIPIERQGAPRWLYYLDLSQTAPVLLLQSPIEPVWEDEQINYAQAFETKEITSHIEGIPNGTRLRFRLTAAPRKRDRHTRKEKPTPPQEREQWLHTQLAAAGTELIDSRVLRSFNTPPYYDGDRRVSHTAVDYEGFLKVTRPTQFETAMVSGIGPGKAYGMGLLRIAGS